MLYSVTFPLSVNLGITVDYFTFRDPDLIGLRITQRSGSKVNCYVAGEYDWQKSPTDFARLEDTPTGIPITVLEWSVTGAGHTYRGGIINHFLYSSMEIIFERNSILEPFDNAAAVAKAQKHLMLVLNHFRVATCAWAR